MKKLIAGVVVILIIISLILIIGKKPETNTIKKPTVKIGAIFPLTGDNSVWGNTAKKALEMSFRDVSLKDNKYNYKILIENADPFDSKATIMAAQKLVNVDKVDAIISYWNTPSLVISDIVEKAKIPQINLGNDDNALKGDYTFLVYSSLKDQSEMLISKISKDGYKNIVVLYSNNHWGNKAYEEVLDKANIYSINILGSETVNYREKSPQLMLKKMEKLNPDIYLLLVESPDLEIIRKKMIELSIDKPISAIETISYSEEKEIFEGAFFIDLPPISNNFKEKFIKYSGIENNHYGATYIYDILNILRDSFEKSKDKKGVVNVLNNLKEYNGHSGKLKQDIDKFFSSPASLKEIRNGKIELLEN